MRQQLENREIAVSISYPIAKCRKIPEKGVAPGNSVATLRVRLPGREVVRLTINRQLFFVWQDNAFVFG